MEKNFADLHIHSYYSDGTMSPEDIVKEALSKKIGLIAIADHNTLDGSRELLKVSKKYRIECISAVELDSLYNGEDVHILGYGVDLYDKAFCDLVKSNSHLLEEVNIKLIRNMEKDYAEISVDDYNAYEYDQRQGGWKALHYFMHKKLTTKLKEGFMYYSKYGDSYSKVSFPNIQVVCDYIHNAGGKAVLAHPGVTIDKEQISQFENEVRKIIGLGVDGIECYYPTHTDEQIRVCLQICKDENLIITSGSDCHGSFLESSEMGGLYITREELVLTDLI